MSERGRVFGLSITETIEWATAFVNLETELLEDGYESGVLCDIPQGRIPFDPDNKIYIEKEIRYGLERLQTEKSYIFDESTRIGISSIGVIHRQENIMTSIARKPWHSDNKQSPLIDFKYLFINKQFENKPKKSYSFKNIYNYTQIMAQNDASARARTEYIYGFDNTPRPQSLLHLIAGEGVNGGVIFSDSFPNETDNPVAAGFPTKSGHPEIAHCTPQLHKYDLDFNPAFSGCPKHDYCLEALASNPRYRQQFGHDLNSLSVNHPAWDIEAFYLAQMAMIGMLMLGTERVIFGGSMFYGEKGLKLIKRIQQCFTDLNAGYPVEVNTLADAEELIGRATCGGSGIGVMSALTMACLTLPRRISDVVVYLPNHQAAPKGRP